MVVRPGIGATTASAVIFSVLLISNLVVFVAAQGRESHYDQADVEDSLADEASVLMGAGATNILLRSAALLSSQVFSCQTAYADASRGAEGLTDAQSHGGLDERTTVVATVGIPSSDNLTMAAPFNGSLAGEFDLSLEITVSGGPTPDGVAFNRTEGHLVHLPVRLRSMASDCGLALAALSAAVAKDNGTDCTSEAVGPTVQGAIGGAEARASGDGFASTVDYTVAAGAACTVSFVVSVVQSGIDGPGGDFTVRLRGEGGSSFAPPAS